MLQVIFHGVDRSPAAEADIARRFEALQRFDNNLSECKATITKVGHQGLGEFSVNSGWFIPQTILCMAVVALASFTQPSIELSYGIKFSRVLMILGAGFFGALFDGIAARPNHLCFDFAAAAGA